MMSLPTVVDRLGKIIVRPEKIQLRSIALPMYLGVIQILTVGVEQWRYHRSFGKSCKANFLFEFTRGSP